MEDPELEAIAREYMAVEARLNELRPQLYTRIYDFRQLWGVKRGWQGWLVERTGLTRERIRQIIALEEKARSGNLPEGVTTRIEGKSAASPGHRVYSVLAKAPINEVAIAVGVLPSGMATELDGTRVDVLADLERITRIKQALADAGIDIVI